MATAYDLNQTQLSTVLSNSVSNQTHGVINAALIDSGFYPTGVFQIPVVVSDDTSSPVNLNLNDYGGDSVALYVETGSNVHVNIDTASPYGSVVAAGDGDDVVLKDVAGGDTLVGGHGHDTLIGGSGSYLIAGSGPTVLRDKVGGDTIQGGTGDDTINVSGPGDTIYGGSGAETIHLSGTGSALYAGSGYEQISLGKGSADSIYLGQNSGSPGTDSITVRGGADSIYVGSGGSADTINAESIASGDSLNLYISAKQSQTTVKETDPSTHTYQISYGSGSSATSITVEGTNVTLHFSGGGTKPV